MEISDEEILKLIKKNREEIIEKMTRNGLALHSVKEQDFEICMAAVKQNGLALQFVGEQDFEICLAAVKQNGLALQFVREQDFEICLAAVRQDPQVLRYVDNIKALENYLLVKSDKRSAATNDKKIN